MCANEKVCACVWMIAVSVCMFFFVGLSSVCVFEFVCVCGNVGAAFSLSPRRRMRREVSKQVVVFVVSDTVVESLAARSF